ncbi:MAG: PilZ domain-containing protein [Myxococcales bacterium]|nr:PilZ domain-containing protein [Myxococcales bacterium]
MSLVLNAAERGESAVPPRFGPPGPFALHASFSTPEGDVAVRLLDVGYARARVVAPPVARLREGEYVRIQFFTPGMAAPVAAPALVQRVVNGHGGVVHELQLVDSARLTTQLPPRSQGAFNRRAAYRVVPDSRAPVQALLRRTDGGELSLPVISLSVTGLACFLPDDVPSRLGTGDHVSIDLTLPESDRSIELAGVVRYLMALRHGQRIGVMFTSQSGLEANRAQGVLSRYIMDIQRQLAAQFR